MMKKYLAPLLCGICAAALLSGCLPAVLVSGYAPEEESRAWEDAIDGLEDRVGSLDDDWSTKSHYWQVLDAQGQEVCVIDAEEAVRRVDDLLDGDTDWKDAGAVEGETALYTYVLMQQKTLLAGQDPEAEREHEEVMRFTVYEDTGVLSVTVLKGLEDVLPDTVMDWEDLLTVHVQVPPETAEALRDPDGLAEG